ncbi:MAG: alpha-N-arabinofuranosidase [Chloroflexi bacterium]|nr:alpha-N-arabinofuranosidase [Chloroflexota bacterium]
MPQSRILVRNDSPIGRISPRLYGQFAEHLGRCCYGGLWVGTGCETVAQRDGFRVDVSQALQALPVPLLRWPGGCYADHYHWRDGIGPPDQRPRRLGISCGLGVEDDNTLGTHEFLQYCAQLGAEPYLVGNLGSGTPQELADWLEYCNSALDTELTRLRRANRVERPFGVTLWGVGNESWGCGGNFDAVGYAREYSRFATILRHVDSAAELVACGHDDVWNAQLLDRLGERLSLVDHLSIHRYWTNGGPETAFDEEQYYALLAEAEATEAFVRRTADIIWAAVGSTRKIGIALDEWGVWHPEARAWGPRGGQEPRSPVTYEQAATLRDALAAAIALEGFHRQCAVLSLASLAQSVNVLHAVVMTDGVRMWRTPTYWTLHLHRPHLGATALAVEVGAADTLPGGIPSVSATASRNPSGLTVTLINRHLELDAEVYVDSGRRELQHASAQLLTATSAGASNSAADPDRVAPVDAKVHPDERGCWRVDLPRHSLATLTLAV